MGDEVRKMIAIGAFFMILALVMDRSSQVGTNRIALLFDSMESVTVISLILFILFYRLLRHAVKLYHSDAGKRREKLCSILPAGFFSFCMVMGYSYYESNSWDLVFGNTLQMVKSGVALIGYFLLFWSCIVILFRCFDNQKNLPKLPARLSSVLQKYKSCLKKYPFRTAFFTLLIAYIPYMIYSYPGIFTSDTKNQLENGYKAFAYADEPLRNHHPVAHTLLLRLCTWIGEQVFSSANTGVFLASLVQSLLLFAAIAWLAVFLTEKNVSEKGISLVLLFYIVSPRIRNFIFLLVKDTRFAPFLLVFLVQLYRIVMGDQEFLNARKKHMSILGLSMLGVILFRQDGVYVLLLTWLAVFVFCKRKRKLAGSLAIGVFLFFTLYTQVLLPVFRVVPTNPREMLSVPFQQTARYLLYAGDEVTDEEEEAIAAILDYNHLAELYNPNLSDPVKATFDKDSGTGELMAYFRVWFRMFWKHPDIYVEATFNNVYGYFYPAGYATELFSYEKSSQHMKKINEILEEFGTDFHYPKILDSARSAMEDMRERIFQLPVLSALNMSACYIWTLILMFFYCLKGNRKDVLLIMCPLLVVLLVCIAGPIYGWYFRYMYSIAVCLPGVVALVWSNKRKCEE